MDSSDPYAVSPLEPPAASERTVLRIGVLGGSLALLATALGFIFFSRAETPSWATSYLVPLRVLLNIVAMVVAGSALSLRPRWHVSWLLVAIVSLLVGLGFFSGAETPSWATSYLVPLRVILSVVAMVVAGSALSLRPRWYASWLMAAAVSFLAGFGFPSTWDSFRLVAHVFGGVALLGAFLAALPPRGRMGVLGAIALFHFSGIFNATTTPSPTPFLTNQLSIIVYRPYLQFAYLSNAYHFYSPDPGPASELWFCIEYEPLKTDPVRFEVLQRESSGDKPLDAGAKSVYKPMLDETGDQIGRPIFDAAGNSIFTPVLDSKGTPLERPVFDSEGKPQYVRTSVWLKVPRRPRDIKDPLNQSFYRRLSITENASMATSIVELPTATQKELEKRRYTDKSYPIYLNDIPMALQCRVPTDLTQNFIIPSYIRHIALQYGKLDRPIAGIKLYRVLHTIIRPDLFVGGEDPNGVKWRIKPFDPRTYYPYYLGDYTAKGELKVPNDPMLYWLVPIVRNPDARPEDFANAPDRLSLAEYRRLYMDYVEIHAGSSHMKGELKQ